MIYEILLSMLLISNPIFLIDDIPHNKKIITTNTNDINVSMSEINTFLLNDNTDKINYIKKTVDDYNCTIYDGFTCYDFSRMLQSNAMQKNITMGILYIRNTINFSENTNLHIINYVYIDGEIYGIEAQEDEIIKILDIKTKYNSSYITVIDINDNFYPRKITWKNGVSDNFRNDVDYNLSDNNYNTVI